MPVLAAYHAASSSIIEHAGQTSSERRSLPLLDHIRHDDPRAIRAKGSAHCAILGGPSIEARRRSPVTSTQYIRAASRMGFYDLEAMQAHGTPCHDARIADRQGSRKDLSQPSTPSKRKTQSHSRSRFSSSPGRTGRARVRRPPVPRMPDMFGRGRALLSRQASTEPDVPDQRRSAQRDTMLLRGSWIDIDKAAEELDSAANGAAMGKMDKGWWSKIRSRQSRQSRLPPLSTTPMTSSNSLPRSTISATGMHEVLDTRSGWAASIRKGLNKAKASYGPRMDHIPSKMRNRSAMPLEWQPKRPSVPLAIVHVSSGFKDAMSSSEKNLPAPPEQYKDSVDDDRRFDTLDEGQKEVRATTVSDATHSSLAAPSPVFHDWHEEHTQRTVGSSILFLNDHLDHNMPEGMRLGHQSTDRDASQHSIARGSDHSSLNDGASRAAWQYPSTSRGGLAPPPLTPTSKRRARMTSTTVETILSYQSSLTSEERTSDDAYRGSKVIEDDIGKETETDSTQNTGVVAGLDFPTAKVGGMDTIDTSCSSPAASVLTATPMSIRPSRGPRLWKRSIRESHTTSTTMGVVEPVPPLPVPGRPPPSCRSASNVSVSFAWSHTRTGETGSATQITVPSSDSRPIGKEVETRQQQEAKEEVYSFEPCQQVEQVELQSSQPIDKPITQGEVWFALQQSQETFPDTPFSLAILDFFTPPVDNDRILQLLHQSLVVFGTWSMHSKIASLRTLDVVEGREPYDDVAKASPLSRLTPLQAKRRLLRQRRRAREGLPSLADGQSPTASSPRQSPSLAQAMEMWEGESSGDADRSSIGQIWPLRASKLYPTQSTPIDHRVRLWRDGEEKAPDSPYRPPRLTSIQIIIQSPTTRNSIFSTRHSFQ